MTTARFLKMVNSPWRMRLFLLWKLPAAWFMGIKVRSCDEFQCEVELPYGWRAQNPFQSIYFAAQCAAGELSTGAIALSILQDKPPVSMLVTQIEAFFEKKASQRLIFTCSDGEAIRAAVDNCLRSGEVQVYRATSVGKLPDGQVAARVYITWSFKAK